MREHPWVTDAYGTPLKFEWGVEGACPNCKSELFAYSDPPPDSPMTRALRAHCSRCDWTEMRLTGPAVKKLEATP